jgi:repressor LexA
LGKVAAGFPILAEENVSDHIPIPRQMIRQEGRYFALRVNGDSMINAGIFDGDLVLVLATRNARHGDIVVALIGDEVTVKRLIIKDGKKFLQAENPDYPNLYPQEEWSIQGKVVGLIRDRL